MNIKNNDIFKKTNYLRIISTCNFMERGKVAINTTTH